MTPLKVTFKVVGGWVPPPLPLHLDALLAYAATRRVLASAEIEDVPDTEALRALADFLPLEKHEQGGDWVWKASAIVPSGGVLNDSGFYTQRRDKVDYALGVRDGVIRHGRYKPGQPMTRGQFQIDTLRGVHRNLLGYFPVQRPFDANDGCMELEAWCIGSPEIIEELLGEISHLGARRRSGYGRILSFGVEKDLAATDNWKRRVAPWPLEADALPIQAAWRPPYWAAENRGQAFLPVGL